MYTHMREGGDRHVWDKNACLPIDLTPKHWKKYCFVAVIIKC